MFYVIDDRGTGLGDSALKSIFLYVVDVAPGSYVGTKGNIYKTPYA